MRDGLKAQELATQKIMDMIQAREILPGTRLYETDLESSLQISRTPIRQAFDKLASDGVLEKREGQKGYFLPKLSPSDFRNAFYFREQLEIMSIKLAIENWNIEKEETMRTLIKSEESNWQSRIKDSFNELNSGFHITLSSLSGNQYLTRALKQVFFRFTLYEFYFNTLVPYRSDKTDQQAHVVEIEMINQHTEIIDAISAKNTQYAIYLVRQHLRESPITVQFISKDVDRTTD